jgi:hypothetical protein
MIWDSLLNSRFNELSNRAAVLWGESSPDLKAKNESFGLVSKKALNKFKKNIYSDPANSESIRIETLSFKPE